ncbi:MAG: hypothetical protein LBI78_05635 [Campylobacteraceae bacterium]|jgi:hypothetical protein|nr:hypothetical protein [Campylobacteraceae bacterium]
MGKIKVIFILLFALFLAGCCVDENGNVVAGDCPVPTKEVVNATFKCNEASCNDLNVSYGTNVGIWSYKNSGTGIVDLNISVSGIPNKEITIVFTNEGSSQVALPSIPIDKTLKSLKNEISSFDEHEVFNFKEPDFMRDEPIELIEIDDKSSLRQAPSYKVWSENNTYNWKVLSDFGSTSRPSTLRKQLTINGRVINLWVENSEFNNSNMNTAKIDYIASYISTIYTSVVSIAGEPWGAHKYSNIIASNQPLDIVFCRLNGAGGYFGSYNNYKTTTYSNSNEAVAIFVSTNMGYGYTLSIIAHELTHASNFYQRYVLMGSNHHFNTFLDEMTAVMMEDVIAGNISYNTASSRYASWLRSPLYQRDFTDWIYLDANSYAIAASFGSFLLRQYGIDFYKTLFKTNGSSTNVIDNAIKVYDSGGLAKALRTWGASIAMLPALTAPKGFGYPARSNDNGFNLEAFDGNAYKSYRTLPTSSPATLAPRTHFPFLRRAANGIYEELFRVPSGVSVSIVVK